MLHEETRRRIEALSLDDARPAVICDVDEVVLQFLAGLERHLAAHGCWLDRSSYALNGNIRRRGSDEPVTTEEVGELLWGFFDIHAETLDPIEGAIEGLAALEADAEIVLLTNLPHRYAAARERNLRGHGLPYPVIANSGPKGPAVRAILETLSAPAVYLDDSPNHLESALEHCPHLTLVHFIADAGFAAVAPPVEGVELKTGSWAEATSFIRRRLGLLASA